MQLIIFFCCPAYILFSPVSGTTQNLYSKTYTSKDGLPSSFILNIYEDRPGYLWIGTSSGLSRFDGKDFINYGYNEGLPDLRTDAMLMDTRFRFWIGTRRGLSQLKGNRFITYPLSDSQQVSYVFNLIETRMGMVWALTNAGVYEFNTDKWQKVNLFPGYINKACRGIVETDEGIYINYGNLLVLKKNDGNFITLTPYNEVSYYYNNLCLSGGSVFISTGDGMYNIKNEQLYKLPGALGRLKNEYYFFFDSKNRCWIGTEQNGLQFVPANDSSILKPFYKRAGVNLISRMWEDRQGNLWVADFNGLIKITEKGYKIIDLPVLSGQGILRNIFQEPSGSFLINDGTLEFHTFKNGIFGKRKCELKGNSPLPNNELIIDNYAVDDKNRYWYSIRGFSLAMQDGNTIYGQSRQLAHLGDEAFNVLFDRYRKKIVVAVRTQKYPCLFNDTGFSRFPVANDIETRGNIMRLHQSANGNIIFATDKGLVYSINKKNECRQQLNEFGLNGSFRGFFNDPGGDLWIVYYSRGIRRYSWQNDSLVFKEQIDKTNGLPDDNVIDMCFDKSGNIWVTMNWGILVLSKKSGTANSSAYQSIAFFTAADLDMEDAYQYKLMRADDGNIWLSTGRRLICFYPDEIDHKALPPGIQIENIKLNLQQTDWTLYTDSLSAFFNLPLNLKLANDKNTIGFYYKAVLSSGTEDALFSYLLEGLDTTWSPLSSSDFVSFVNLPAGRYSFKVKTRLPNTNWSDEAVFIFEIKKAFWETWWFRLLVIMAASSLIVGVFQYRLKQFRTRAELKNQLQELESKALKAQMNPHFIFNAMNSIQSLIMNNRSDEAGSYISKFAKLMRHVLENADAALVSIDKELFSVQLYIELEKLRMNVDLDYAEEVDPGLDTQLEKIPSLILQPFVENALWHGLSKKPGYKKLSIIIKVAGNWITLKITDNGVGREKAVEYYDQLPEGHLSKATGITMQRLISYNKTPDVQPIEIIDLKDEDGNPSGTTIILQIKREHGFTE